MINVKAGKAESGSCQRRSQTAAGAAWKKNHWNAGEAAYPGKERTHRLCTRGAMLESFLLRPEVLTNGDVMDILETGILLKVA